MNSSVFGYDAFRRSIIRLIALLLYNRAFYDGQQKTQKSKAGGIYSCPLGVLNLAQMKRLLCRLLIECYRKLLQYLESGRRKRHASFRQHR